jgi:putative redox protein
VTTTPRTRTVGAVWEEGMRCRVTAGRFELVADEPESAGGTDLGPQPTDLLLAALASCFAMAVAYAARKRDIVLADLAVSATGVYDGPGFADLTLEVSSSHDAAELERLVTAAKRLCYFSNTFRNQPDITVSITEAISPPR